MRVDNVSHRRVAHRGGGICTIVPYTDCTILGLLSLALFLQGGASIVPCLFGMVLAKYASNVPLTDRMQGVCHVCGYGICKGDCLMYFHTLTFYTSQLSVITHFPTLSHTYTNLLLSLTCRLLS